jgi:hypothetical protein
MDGYVWNAAPSPSCVGRRSPKLPPKKHPLPAFQIGLVDGKLGGTKGANDCSTATFDPVRSFDRRMRRP